MAKRKFASHYLRGYLLNPTQMYSPHLQLYAMDDTTRTTGPPSYVNSQVRNDTWHEHHKEDLPHIKFCGTVATRQNGLRWLYLREQPVGTWVDQIPPWTKLATCNLDQRTTGLRDSH
eukprot:6627128-Pyramimonas_sp.AAC.1